MNTKPVDAGHALSIDRSDMLTFLFLNCVCLRGIDNIYRSDTCVLIGLFLFWV